MNKIARLLFVFLVLLQPLVVSAQTSQIGDIKVIQNVDDGIMIEVYDVSVSSMLGRDVMFGFMIYASGEAVEGSWVQIDPQEVLYDPAYWSGKASWCKYTYEYLKKIENQAGSLNCIFFVLDAGLNENIGEKAFEIKIDTGKKSSDKTKEKTGMSDEAKGIVIEYSVAQGVEITIRDAVLSYHRVKEIKSADDNPLSANTYAVYETRDYYPGAGDIQRMLDLFYANKWASLEAEYGVSREDRHYPTTLYLKDSRGDKLITYRSGGMPSNEPPKEFFAIGEGLVKIADEIANR